MKHLIADVRAFHEACDLPCLDKPQFPDPSRIELRNKLLHEEYQEYLEGVEAGDIVEVADALADMVYIIVGTALEFGIPLDKVWYRVQEANMDKLDTATGQAIRRSDGKVLKRAGWHPPDIAALISMAERGEQPHQFYIEGFDEEDNLAAWFRIPSRTVESLVMGMGIAAAYGGLRVGIGYHDLTPSQATEIMHAIGAPFDGELDYFVRATSDAV